MPTMKTVRNTIRRRVKNGIAYLEGITGNYDWVNKINLERLEINDCFKCVLGQIYGDYFKHIADNNLNDKWAKSHGFMPSGYYTENDIWIEGSELLTNEWTRQLALVKPA